MKKWSVCIRDKSSSLVADRVIFAPSCRAARSLGTWWAVQNLPKHWTEYTTEARVLKLGRRNA